VRGRNLLSIFGFLHFIGSISDGLVAANGDDGDRLDCTKVFSVVRSVLSWKRARVSYPFSEAIIILKKPHSISSLGRWVDAEFVFVSEFSCTQESTSGVENWPEDHVYDSCSDWRIHSVNNWIMVSPNGYENRYVAKIR